LTASRSRSGALRWVAVALVLLVVVAGVAASVLMLRTRGVLADRTDELLAAVGRAVGLPIRAEDVTVSWWPPGVTARDLEIPDESPYGPGDLARADEARIQVALLPLLRGEIVVTEVRLISPVLFVVRGVDGGWNVGATPAREVAPRPDDDDGGSGPAPAVVIDSVRVRNARLVYRDRAIPGLGELEVRAGNALLRREDDLYRVDFNAQALGGPEENVSGWMLVPRVPLSDVPATLHIQGSALSGQRLPELIALLRGEMPFGIALEGDVAARVDVALPVSWPPSRAAGRLAIDARAASMQAVSGWVVKPAGLPLDVDLGVRAGAFGIAVDHAAVTSGDVRLVANLAEPPVPSPESGQQALVLALEGFDAARLAGWVPALATLQPRGALFMEGRVTPGPNGVATDLRLATNDLTLAREARPVTVASASVDLSLAHGSQGVLGSLRVSEVRTPEGTIASVGANVGGGLGQPLEVQVHGARLERNGVEIETASADLLLRDGEAEVRKVEIVGLGGELAARGRVQRDRDGVYTVALKPQWANLDVERLIALVGGREAGTGVLAGAASLETSGAALDAAIANLNGTFEATLGNGTLPGLNVARVTLANLDSIPRLEEAIEGRARERVPELLATTTSFDSLRVSGTVNEGRIQVGELKLDSPQYAIDARGRLAFDGDTDLEGTLVLTQEASRSLLSGAGVLEALAGSDEQVRIPIAVRGVYPDLRSLPSKDYLADAAARAVRLPGRDRAASFLRRLLGGED
jgi:hypothetical protein